MTEWVKVRTALRVEIDDGTVDCGERKHVEGLRLFCFINDNLVHERSEPILVSRLCRVRDCPSKFDHHESIVLVIVKESDCL